MKLVIFTIFATLSVVRGNAADCFTPDGYRGKCVSIYQCPHAAALLDLPKVPKANIEYLKKLKCDSPAAYSICCGPEMERPSGVIEGDCNKRMFTQPPDQNSRCCGTETTDSRLLIMIDQYPWLALIQYDTANGTRVYCGGSLISSRYVLTAAHCVTGLVLRIGTPSKVYLGEYSTTSNGPDCVSAVGGGTDCTDPLTIIPIDRTIAHPHYDKTSHKNDIALIRLKTWAPYTDFISPVCLPTTNIDATRDSESMVTAGWGVAGRNTIRSTVKQESYLRYIKQEVCQSIFKSPELPTNQWEKLICVGGENTKHACTGDSGGPLLVKPGKYAQIIGVESFSHCMTENVARVYTNVFEHKDWIRNTIENAETLAKQ